MIEYNRTLRLSRLVTPLVCGVIYLGLMTSSILQPAAACQQRKQIDKKVAPAYDARASQNQPPIDDTVELISSAAQNGDIQAPTQPGQGMLLLKQFTIQAPAGATRLLIELSGDQDVDLYVRLAQRIEIEDGSIVADFISESDANNETITITPSSAPALQTGKYYIAVSNFGPGAAKFTLKATVSGSQPDPGRVVNVSAASFRGDALASGQIVSAFGSALATRAEAPLRGLPEEIAGTRVRVRDSAGVERGAPLFFVAPTQINYLMPNNMAFGEARVTVTSGDGAVSTGSVSIAPVAPGLFSANLDGQGVAVALVLRVRADGSRIYEPALQYDAGRQQFVSVPIDLGPVTDQVFLILFGTGIRGRSALSAVSVTIGGVAAETLYAGQQDGFYGLYGGLDQLNVRMPRGLAGRGDVDIALTVDGSAANTVKINVR